MKWMEWNENHWVLVDPEGAVVDEIERDSRGFFVLKSSGKKYIDIKKAKNARLTGTGPN